MAGRGTDIKLDNESKDLGVYLYWVLEGMNQEELIYS